MRVKVVGFPEGFDPQAEHQLSENVAVSVAKTLQRFKIEERPNSILVSFKRDQSPNVRPTERIDSDDIPDFSKLISPPRSNASRLKLTSATAELVENAIVRASVSDLVYNQWGLNNIDPCPRLSLNFVGPPGTGKTLAAHYIASSLGKKILEVSYADIVSKYFGEAAKNLAYLYRYASDSNAVLFIDEAETLLSKRGSGQDGGADHAVNSMRSQLLILIEKTPILSIFASNLVSSYDEAFLSRMISVPFELPDEKLRFEIWRAHLPENMPLEIEVNPIILAANYPGLNGRQISRSVIEAAFKAAIAGKRTVSLDDFEWAISSVANPAFIRTSDNDVLNISESTA